MKSRYVKREEQIQNIFSEDTITDNESVLELGAPIEGYSGYLDPSIDGKAVKKGDQLAKEINRNKIADFEKNNAYCEKNKDNSPDRMVHVSTFKILNGIIYMTYYANTATDKEDPLFQEARLAFCPINAPTDMTIVTIQKVGEQIGGKSVDRIYDTILLYKGGNELYLMWTASLDGLYYRLFCTFNTDTLTLSAIRPNRFQVGCVANDFSTTGIISALAFNKLPHKTMFSDIGIMQKLSVRVENGETYYYTGSYSGYFTFIIKSKDLITWEYVSTPDFKNMSHWENATYVIHNKCFYFVRQNECNQGFLTCFDLESGKWEKPFLIRDAQSRSDFLYYDNNLYLFHAPVNREGFGIVLVDTDDISKSKALLVANMNESLFYPFVDAYDDSVYISYTIGRKHIRLSKFIFSNYLDG